MNLSLVSRAAGGDTVWRRLHPRLILLFELPEAQSEQKLAAVSGNDWRKFGTLRQSGFEQ